MPDNAPLIDVAQLLDRYSLDELLDSADQYFRRISNPSYLWAKPFASIDEAPELVGHFGALIASLDLVPGDVILDFGCGSGWSSRYLAQLGCKVIGMDASNAALSIAERSLEAMPMPPATTPPEFLRFDGRRIELADASVDRISCIDAFHHVSNQADVLAEFRRVLKVGGVVVLVEPGPHHSTTSLSQSEMRNHVVVERDIVIEDLESLALAAGFESMRVGVYNPIPDLVPVAAFASTLDGADDVVLNGARRFQTNHRHIVLRVAGERTRDSRRRHALHADFDVVRSGSGWSFTAENTAATWLPSGQGVGAVNLGVHTFDSSRTLLDLDFARVAISDEPVESGAVVHADFDLPPLPADVAFLTFDLVAEGVAWFEDVGGRAVTRAADG